MPWVKIDDQMPDHPKIAALSDAAFRAHVTAICYAARNLTDGFIPMKKAKEFGSARSIKELVPALWELAEGGFSVHDYLRYQPPRAQVLAEREAAKARMSAARSSTVRPNISGNSLAPDPTPTPDPIPDPTPIPEPPSETGGRSLKTVWENRIGMLGSADRPEFNEYARVVPEQWFLDAIEETVTKANRPSWAFCRTVLKRCVETRQPPGMAAKGKPKKAGESMVSESIQRQRREMEEAIASGAWTP